MKKYIYPACFYKEETGYSVLFPDFSGGTCGDTLEEAQRMAVDFLYGVIAGAREDGEKLPAPSDMAAIELSTEFEYESAFIAPVSVDIDKYANYLDKKNKTVRKNVTIPLWLSEAAEKEHINFSSVLQDALKKQLDL